MTTFIPDNISELCNVRDKANYATNVILIHPFTRKDVNGLITFDKLKQLPKIFKSKGYKEDKISVTRHRDIYMELDNTDDQKPKHVYKMKRRVIYDNDCILIEQQGQSKLPKECFPTLREYESVKLINRYISKISNNVYFVINLSEKNEILDFYVKVTSLSVLSEKNISKLNKFMNKNVAKYKID